MSKHYSCLAMVSLLGALSATVHAQAPCDQRGKVVDELHQNFHEVQVGTKLMPGGQLLELFVSPAGTWTMLMSLPTGKSCLIAAGGTFSGGTQTASAPDLGA